MLKVNYYKLKSFGFKPIQYDDEKIFRAFFQKFREIACYSSAWLYVTQAARGLKSLGYFYQNEKFIIALGYHHEHFVLIHPIGKIPKKFFQLVKELYKLLNKPIYVKKVFEDEAVQIEEILGKKHFEIVTTEEYPWHEVEKHDDDTFPEIIINIPEILKIVNEKELAGKYARNIRNKLNRFKRLSLKLEYLPLSETNSNEIIEMLKSHFGEDESNYDAYLNMLNILSRNQNRNIYIDFVALHNNKPIGFFAAEVLDKYSAGLYASIALREFTGLSETLHFKIFKELNERGIKYLNLGGSEVKSLHDFKMKFTCNMKCLYKIRKIPILVLKKCE